MNPLKIFLRANYLCMSPRLSVINQKRLRFLKNNRSYCSCAFNETFQLNEDEDFYSKIIYNEIISKTPKRQKNTGPIFLKYLTEESTKEHENKIKEEPEDVNFPFTIREEVLSEIKTNVETEESNTKSDNDEIEKGEWKTIRYSIDRSNIEDPRKWKDELVSDDKIDDLIKFGTCDPTKPVSKIPCGGCGAFLHCNDASIPGFLPREVFEISSKNDLQKHVCQRCYFLKAFNVALGVTIPPAQYEEIISSIRNKAGLVIFLVDLLDFPCSIYPEIFNLIGSTRPLVVVGNKVDLLIQEDPSFLKNFKESLMSSLREHKFNVKNIKHVALISAKTGYGVEKLISTLQHSWGNDGDVYLIGCTNVGKSSLFNAFIQSDYCKINAVNILQRATVSAWPGTTLNLLKFPISKTVKWRLVARQHRLLKEEEQKLAIERLKWLNQNIKFQQIPLSDHIGLTHGSADHTENSEQPNVLNTENSKVEPAVINTKNPAYAFSKWFYDTPGVVHHDQILNLLTTQELLLTLPTKIISPRNFKLRPGHSIFIGGIARLDYTSGAKLVWFTVFASHNLPITVTKLEDADLVYQKLLGSPLFRVPTEGKKRLSKWPSLASKKIEIHGNPPPRADMDAYNFKSYETKDADADIVLTSAGWVSVNVPPSYRCFLEAWTPEGRGIHVRKVPIIRKGHLFRGQKIGKSPAYENVVEEVRGYSIMDDPPF